MTTSISTAPRLQPCGYHLGIVCLSWLCRQCRKMYDSCNGVVACDVCQMCAAWCDWIPSPWWDPPHTCSKPWTVNMRESSPPKEQAKGAGRLFHLFGLFEAVLWNRVSFCSEKQNSSVNLFTILIFRAKLRREKKQITRGKILMKKRLLWSFLKRCCISHLFFSVSYFFLSRFTPITHPEVMWK